MIVIVPEKAIKDNINRLTNQIWKLIPMKENNEDWETQIETVITEILGLQNIYVIADDKFVTLLSKLRGLKDNPDIKFYIYRKTVFECISLLREMRL